MSLQLLHFVALIIGLVAYLGLTVFCIVTWARRVTGRAAFVASITTLGFMAALALTGIGPISFTLELAALLCWMGLLGRVIGLGPRNFRNPGMRFVSTLLGLSAALAVLAAGFAWWIPAALSRGASPPISWLFAAELLITVAGLVLLEQVVRNTRDDYRWRLRYLNIGLGTLLLFQLVHNALALMFNAYLPPLVAIQPIVFALAAPFIAVASLRNAENPLQMNLSRRFVFRSGVLVATGLGLLLMGLAGYFARLFEGDWGTALLALAATVAIVATVTVFGSTRIRARTRRFIGEHLFASKYDYRDEWRRVTAQLTEPSPDFDLGQQVVRALAGPLQSGGGALWRLSERGLLTPMAQLHTGWDQPLTPQTSDRLQRFFQAEERVVDLSALPEAARECFEECEDLIRLAQIRFVVPLMVEERLFGIAALNEPPVDLQLTWEDADLLMLIARESAGFIALQEAERSLADADKLNSFNQISAFVVHDVKTIASQLSLLLQNADKHKTNPAFIDDMLATVDNAVNRMRHLLDQLRTAQQQPQERLNLGPLLETVVGSFAAQQPRPRLEGATTPIAVLGDGNRLVSAIGHLVQNAIDATSEDGRVCVSLENHGPWAEIHIRDTGQGMDEAFIRETLFQPFTSTKGVAGMGVGAYQARAYVRSLGGDLKVTSSPGQGSHFTIHLPAVKDHA